MQFVATTKKTRLLASVKEHRDGLRRRLGDRLNVMNKKREPFWGWGGRIFIAATGALLESLVNFEFAGASKSGYSGDVIRIVHLLELLARRKITSCCGAIFVAYGVSFLRGSRDFSAFSEREVLDRFRKGILLFGQIGLPQVLFEENVGFRGRLDQENFVLLAAALEPVGR